MAAATNLAPENQYFYEDVVYRMDKRGNVVFGIVMENDDLDLSDESSDNEENLPKRKKGEIRMIWHPSGVEELVNCKKVHLADRTLMPGDVVRRMIKGKDTQRGYCRDVELTACVQVIGTKQVLTDIKSEDLIPLQEFATDMAVCLDSWVGGIRMTHFKLWLVTPDGSHCVINEMDSCVLGQLEEARDSDNDFPHPTEFYPGQSLWGPVHCLEDAQWLQCTKEMKAKRKLKPQKITKVIVEKVETDWIGVHWQCRAYSKDGWSDQVQPKFVVEGEDLKKIKLLNVFEPSTVQVGNRNFYIIKGNENVITREQWRKQQRDIYQVPKQSPKKTRSNIMVTKLMEDKEQKKNKTSNQLMEENGKSNGIRPQDIIGNNVLMPPPPNQHAESSDEWDTEDTGSQSDSTSVSSCCSSMSSAGKKKKGPALMTKVLKKKKLRKAKKKIPPVPLIPGTKIVVETLSTNTKANVVWQDGSVEFGIPSTQLYPIHHLDDKEFFPGDFVVDQKEESRMYGVVQSVDHQGRTAKIKWFRTYTSSQNPEPIFLEEREVSVYDLKDHPDFQYRPGTLVIRIANFEGEDTGCTAGQVLDNYPEGRVKVWWIDDHVSMCWPQDLYKVGEYDSDEGELWDDVSSDSSWETELEDCFIADNDVTEQTELDNIKPKLAAHIEKARIAMSRLEEIFTQNPSLQTTEVMRKLLEVYKDCRYMDKLMGTAFFHECHFQGLLERVRERGRANVAQRMADQVTRLFTPKSEYPEESIDKDNSKSSNNGDDPCAISVERQVTTIINESENDNIPNIESNIKKQTDEDNVNRLFIYPNPNPNPEDSGLYSAENSKKESGSSESSGEFLISEDVNNIPECSSTINDITTPEKMEVNKMKKVPTSLLTSQSIGTSQVCVKLCNLIKAQLVLAHAEVSKRFGLGKMSLSDADKTSSSPRKKQKGEEEERLETMSDPSCSVEIPLTVYTEGEGFSIEETAPDSHKFKLTMFQPTDLTNFFRTVSKELKLLKNSLPPGVWVKGFEDRIDLYSVMFHGPEKTPYEDGLFLFDFQLSADYPAAPPLCHYISYCSDRLNPNLYEDGKVCVSLLGTWSGRGTEVWTNSSTLLQVIVSIQGLILVNEPYFNEAGFEKQKGSQQGRENSRMYNEMVVLKLVQAQTKLLLHPPPVFKDIIIAHFKKHAEKLLQRLELWMEISEQHNNQHPLSPVTPTTFKEIANIDQKVLPEFPLIPASRGFCITLRKTLITFKSVLVKKNIIQRSDEWQDNENTELMNNITNQCQETSKSVDSKIAECDESSSNSNSNSNMQENSEKLILNGNKFKEMILSSPTNNFAAAPSETKKNTSSQNPS
ncbi:PREDICTED: (E3-independent) E2 ubiquitin-conjugating enzyme UBE2O [Cyphomyrmex costatus]|uniref:Ubiquitin-conjugating enzyme E2 O n=1 Tax=Cyphomyrmex costatus TaxID=456900 RepID=A0A195D6X5_9HYME|nr:PREDICTED: (E3-independent) E2 ubiquitin-conjugating enzyme UBE2O [Cyphomyrmex costatus]KYN08640.1 Ubiquitin-conjugating enzyme E2 O [Cyphomyrmex costatus]